MYRDEAGPMGMLLGGHEPSGQKTHEGMGQVGASGCSGHRGAERGTGVHRGREGHRGAGTPSSAEDDTWQPATAPPTVTHTQDKVPGDGFLP